MTQNFKLLPHFTLDRNAILNRRSANRRTSVALTDPATVVMTDFNEVTPFAIEPTANIDATNDKMIACGVRLLFVANTDGTLQGLVTATDVLGEKPLQYLKEHGGKREDILCQDIMTARDHLDVLHLKDVENASVGDIVETMKLFKRQHILVTAAMEGSDSECICGIFSTTQISRQLGFHIESAERANTFAELEQALAAG